MARFFKSTLFNSGRQFSQCSFVASLFFLSMVVTSSGCMCTAEFVYGLTITVNDAEGEPVCNATVTITDGDYEEVLEAIGDGQYYGAGERGGTYEIRVEAEGFISQTATQTVSEDTCHVIPESVQVTLESDPEFDGSTESTACVASSDGGSSADAGSDDAGIDEEDDSASDAGVSDAG